jgi:high-affinity K+ transport system ATPase subunit B
MGREEKELVTNLLIYGIGCLFIWFFMKITLITVLLLIVWGQASDRIVEWIFRDKYL